MIPRSNIKTVGEHDVIGPILMDELYESKYSRFPVVGSEHDSIVGMLYLRDLVSARHGGIVQDVMKPAVQYVHEDQTLYHVLHAFLTTKQHAFTAINSSGEHVGMITIEDVLEQVIGHKLENDFDAYDDKQAVAALTTKPKDEIDLATDEATSDDSDEST